MKRKARVFVGTVEVKAPGEFRQAVELWMQANLGRDGIAYALVWEDATAELSVIASAESSEGAELLALGVQLALTEALERTAKAFSPQWWEGSGKAEMGDSGRN